MNDTSSEKKNNMKMSKLKIGQIRRKYKKAWGMDWPHSDYYMSLLWVEAKEFHGQGPTSKQKAKEATSTVLEFMRFEHEFQKAKRMNGAQ